MMMIKLLIQTITQIYNCRPQIIIICLFFCPEKQDINNKNTNTDLNARRVERGTNVQVGQVLCALNTSAHL